MKKILLLLTIVLLSCSKPEDNTPYIINNDIDSLYKENVNIAYDGKYIIVFREDYTTIYEVKMVEVRIHFNNK